MLLVKITYNFVPHRKREDDSDGQVKENQDNIRVIFTGMTGSAVTRLTQVYHSRDIIFETIIII